MKLADRIRQESQKTQRPGPSAIRAALVEQGHSVTISYIKLVLWRQKRPRKKKAKKRTPWQKHYPKENSQSEAIRSLLDDDPDITTAAMLAKLKKQGIEVSANLIKVVRHNWRKKREATERMKAKGEERRRKGLDDFPVAGAKKMQTDAEREADLEELFSRIKPP